MAHRLLVNTLPINKPASPSGMVWRDTRTPVQRSSQASPTQLPAAQRGPRTRWSRRSHDHPHCPTPGSGWSARWGPSSEPRKSRRSRPAPGSWASCHSCPPWSPGPLLLLVCGVRLDLGLEQRVGDAWRDKLAFHIEHLQNPMMDGNGELHTCHRTFTYQGYLHPKFDLIQLWRMNIMLDSNVELETFLLLEKKSR